MQTVLKRKCKKRHPEVRAAQGGKCGRWVLHGSRLGPLGLVSNWWVKQCFYTTFQEPEKSRITVHRGPVSEGALFWFAD